MKRAALFFSSSRGETTLGSAFSAIVLAFGLVMIVNIGIFLYTMSEVYFTKTKADRAMAIYGGYTPEVTRIIQDNLRGIADLSKVTVNATPYPVNRNAEYSLLIQYDFTFGLISWSNSSLGFANITVPIRSHAYGYSEAVIR
jgi:hypothetical protein